MSDRHDAAHAESGFILIEVMVAFLILAIALAVGVQAIAQGTMAVRRADEMTAASLVIHELDATLMQALPGAGVWQGTHGNGSDWRIVAETLSEDDEAAPLLAIAVNLQPRGARVPYHYRSFAIGSKP
jgi:type II secretory pathway pseudopilin PulG